MDVLGDNIICMLEMCRSTIYPLVNQHNSGKSLCLLGKSFFLGKLTLHGLFSIAMLNYQQVNVG